MNRIAEVWLPLSQGKVTVIDFDDFEKVRGIKWCAKEDGRNWYAIYRPWDVLTKRQTTIYLHRFLLDAPSKMEVDHINFDGLDNRRTNIRLCSHAQNQRNIRKKPGCGSAFKGVYRHNPTNKWLAKISRHNKQIHLGLFEIEKDAALAYDSAAREISGEFAVLNFPLDNNPA